MTHPLILHGYSNSPFAEKIRRMFGYTGISWRAMVTPPQPPRPSLDPVIGGYRKIPVLQIGADYFCDTRLIAYEIATLTNRPELSADTAGDAVNADVTRFDSDIFRAGIIMIPRSKFLWAALKSNGLGIFKLVADRKRMTAAGGFKTASMKKIAADWSAHLADLNTRVANGFLGGDQPNAADFSAFHIIWFAKSYVGSLELADLPNLRRWYVDMTSNGHGSFTPITVSEALRIAKDVDPRPLGGSHSDLVGNTVEISPTDYGRDGTTGRLVYIDDIRYVIARETETCGTVHVHFPIVGFKLESARSAQSA